MHFEGKYRNLFYGVQSHDLSLEDSSSHEYRKQYQERNSINSGTSFIDFINCKLNTITSLIRLNYKNRSRSDKKTLFKISSIL